MENKPAACPAIWFSGFFGLGAVVHLIRLVSRVSIVVADQPIPLWASAVLALVFGGLSVGLLILGMKKPCCSKPAD